MGFSASHICFQAGSKAILDDVTVQIQPVKWLPFWAPTGRVNRHC